MTDFKASDRDVSRAIRSWLHEARHEDASRIAGAVLDQVEAAPRRRASWPAWRTATMNKITLGLGAAAVVVIGLFIGAQLLGGPSSNTGAPSVEPTATENPSSPPAASLPPLSQSFTSTQHGISLSYPEGWDAQAATEPWTDSTFPLEFGQPQADWLSDPNLGSDLFLTIASQPITDPTPDDPISDSILEEWVAEQMASEEGCAVTEPIAVDFAPGLIGAGGCNLAVVATANVTMGQFIEGTAGRGYWIQLYTGDAAHPTYNSAWFAKVLATVRLHSEDAAD